MAAAKSSDMIIVFLIGAVLAIAATFHLLRIRFEHGKTGGVQWVKRGAGADIKIPLSTPEAEWGKFDAEQEAKAES